MSLQLNLTSSVINQSFEVLFFFFPPSLPCFFPGAIFCPLLVFSTFIPLNSDSGGILSVVILSGLNFRLVSKELFYLCFNKALGESNSEDRVLAAASSPAKHSQPLLPQDKSSYLHAPPQPAALLAQVLHGNMERDSIPPTQLPPGRKSQRPKTQTLDDDTHSIGPAYLCPCRSPLSPRAYGLWQSPLLPCKPSYTF